jgi:hypothetical protein
MQWLPHMGHTFLVEFLTSSRAVSMFKVEEPKWAHSYFELIEDDTDSAEKSAPFIPRP